MNKLPIPTTNRVIIKRDPAEDPIKQVNGIFIYTKEPVEKYTGIVISLPEILNNEDTKTILESEIQIGDRVMFFPHVSLNFEHLGEWYVSVRYIDILLKFL